MSGTTDSGQGSATSCGSTSDDEIVNIGDDLQVKKKFLSSNFKKVCIYMPVCNNFQLFFRKYYFKWVCLKIV